MPPLRLDRCAFCHFDIVETDDVSLVHSKTQPDIPLPASDHRVQACIKDPFRNDPVSHWQCHDMTKPPHRRRLLYSLGFLFEPSVVQDKRRVEFYQHLGASLINPLLGLAFPPEIALMVASHLPREVLSCLAVFHEMEAHFSAGGGRKLIYEGNGYIAKTADLQGGRLGKVAIRQAGSREPDVIHIGIDHVGIRTIILGDWDGESPDETRNRQLWWRTIRDWKEACSRISFASDVLILHDFRTIIPRPKSLFLDNFWWESCHEQPKLEKLRFERLNSTHHGSQPKIMRNLRIAGAKGLSVHWNGGPFLNWKIGLLFIGSHASDSDMTPYNHMATARPQGIDIYIPLDEKDPIKEVWLRKVEDRRSSLLMFVTSLGRVIVAGLELRRYSSRPTYTLLDEACKGFYYDVNTERISILGFESPAPSRPPVSRFPRIPPKLSSRPSRHHMHTFAEISDVVSVRLCHMPTNGMDSVAGLFLTHGDGRRSCVGRVRLDCLGAVLEVGGAQGMTLHTSESEKGWRFEEAIELLDEVIEQGDTQSVYVRWTGRLEWRVSDRDCVVSYHKDLSNLGH